MGAAYIGMVRRVATVWTDMLIDMEQRWTGARSGVRSPTMGYSDLVRDSVGVWLAGLQAWERLWMPGMTQAAPIVMLRGTSLVGDVAIAPPIKEPALQWTDLGHLGAGSPIPHTEVHASVNATGTLRVSVHPKPVRERATGLYRGVVYTTTESGTPCVVADVVLEVPPPAA